MYETILVPTDGSEHAERAAEHAASLAARFDADVVALSVVDLDAAAGPFSAGGVDDQFVGRLEEAADAALETVERAVAERGGVAVDAVTRQGQPTDTILDYADERDVDAIAMGTHGRTGVERYVTGSVCEHVVRFAEVPVLTTRATARSRVESGYDDVLVPTDGSEYAAVAYEHGVGIARAFDARVHALTVVDDTDLAGAADADATSAVRDGLQAAGESATARIAELAREAGLEAVTAATEGTPARTLLDYADEQDVDLIAMGTAGRTGPNRFLLGSTTERTLRHADVPVLAVNARRRSD